MPENHTGIFSGKHTKVSVCFPVGRPRPTSVPTKPGNSDIG